MLKKIICPGCIKYVRPFKIWYAIFFTKSNCDNCEYELRPKNKTLMMLLSFMVYFIWGAISGLLYKCGLNPTLSILFFFLSFPLDIFITCHFLAYEK